MSRRTWVAPIASTVADPGTCSYRPEFGIVKRLPGAGRYESTPPVRAHKAPAGIPKKIDGPARFEVGGWGTMPAIRRDLPPHMRSDVDMTLFGRDMDRSNLYGSTTLDGHLGPNPHTQGAITLPSLNAASSKSSSLINIGPGTRARMRAMGLQSPRSHTNAATASLIASMPLPPSSHQAHLGPTATTTSSHSAPMPLPPSSHRGDACMAVAQVWSDSIGPIAQQHLD